MMTMKEVYAALEKYPVKISYPKDQISINADWFEIDKYKRSNDFVTNYKFGPYTLTHRETKHMYNALTQGVLYLGCDDHAFSMSALIQKNLLPNDKQIVKLFKAVKDKSENKSFENPYEKAISDSIYALEFYVHDLPSNMMSTTKIKRTMEQLNQIKIELLATQNIK